MANEQIKAVVKHPGKIPTIEMVDNSLPELQRIIGGYIEIGMKWIGSPSASPGSHMSIAYCDEEALIKTPRPRLNVWRPSDRSPICGPIVVVGSDDQGNDISLTDRECAVWCSLLALQSPEIDRWIDDPQIDAHLTKHRNDCDPSDWSAVEKMLASQLGMTMREARRG